MLMTLGDP